MWCNEKKNMSYVSELFKMESEDDLLSLDELGM